MRTLRKQKSFSQERLAHICDLDRTFISLLERGKRQPSLKTIFTISEALSLSPSELIKLVEEEFSQ
ncbi:helix-turn-helix domain-containing protein [Maridesulfovibrio sp.]|uniref:helix-turn-helix domain-containing protein n=1 Tax=Maridesulfovibrio sp. TaxID=2795000 RepID=UPI003AFF6DDB